ncbi:MAG TPA: ATP-binding cassette domain-containing protein, partial [Firmicutes bacterium]|nr:ATP-binding cassette domain-containing protein [Bacillota bacterium]
MENAVFAVAVENLSKRYPKVEALKGIDLNITAGQIWGLLGPNGSGKSTFLKCLIGLVQKDTGSFWTAAHR